MLPKYSEKVPDLLENGDILKKWNKFIEETAHYVLKLPYKFESKHPCVVFASGSNPWVKTQRTSLIKKQVNCQAKSQAYDRRHLNTDKKRFKTD